LPKIDEGYFLNIPHTIHKNTEALTDGSREFGIQVNTEKCKHMLMSRYQKAGQNHKTGNRRFENVAKFRYLGMTIKDQNLVNEETKTN
jgi:hypothetical protein